MYFFSVIVIKALLFQQTHAENKHEPDWLKLNLFSCAIFACWIEDIWISNTTNELEKNLRPTECSFYVPVAPEKNSTSFYLVVLIKCIISFQLFSDLALFIHTDQTNLTPNCVPTPFYFKFNFWIHFSCHR